MAKGKNKEVEFSAYLAEVFTPIRDELAAWEITYQEALRSNEEIYSRLGSYMFSYSSRKIRPALILLSARTALGRALLPEDLRILVKLAVAVELIHTSGLIHNDIIEKVQLKQKDSQSNFSSGLERSLLFGEYLLSKAFSLLSKIELPQVNACISDAFKRICEGKAMRLRLRSSLVLREEEYLKIIKACSASLISSACWLGAYIVEAKQGIRDSLSNFGLNFGYALQIVDDCLEVMAKEDRRGDFFVREQDLGKGGISLSLVSILSFLPQEEKKRISNFLLSEKKDTPRIKTLAFSYRATELALKKAKYFSDRAKREIAALPKNQAKESLIAIADFVLERLAA